MSTPERVRFEHRLAGPGQRSLAWLIDLTIRGIAIGFVALLVGVVTGVSGLAEVGTGAFLVLLFVVDWFYGILFESLWSGRTPGKFALSIRVVRTEGAPIEPADAVLRNLLRAADFLPMFFGVGVVAMLLDARMRRLGDLVAGTVVVIEDRSRVLAGVPIEPPVSEDERHAMPAGLTLSPSELEVIESFLRRRGKLTDERAEELAALFGPALSDRTGLEAPSWERVLTLAYARATGRDR